MVKLKIVIDVVNIINTLCIKSKTFEKSVKKDISWKFTINNKNDRKIKKKT